MTIALERLIAELEGDRSLDLPMSVRERLDALDRLDAIFAGSELPDSGGRVAEAGIHGRAQALCHRLEVANRAVYQAIRGEIQQGVRPNLFLEQISSSIPGSSPAVPASGQGYDYLDELISGVLQLQMLQPAVIELAAEMVFYQPTPARHTFDLLGRTALSEQDVLVDLGSGLGHVPLLTAICTGARSLGVELEPSYVDAARRCAHALKLKNVSFIQQDVRAADLSSGTVLYLYTPFAGTILRTVLDSIRQEAARRAIRVCTFGPCTMTVAEERWLQIAGPLDADRINVFRSRD